MWTHNSPEMLEGNERPLSVRSHFHFSPCLQILWQKLYPITSVAMIGMLALFAQSRFAICPRCGRNLTWRSQLHHYLSRIRIKWLVPFFCIPHLGFLFSRNINKTKYMLCCLFFKLPTQVWILCNDCGKTSQVRYHVVAQKCLNCKSYNTRQTRG